MKAKEFLSPLFVNVSYNFTPFISQVVAHLLGAQAAFPGKMTAFGGFVLFIGCTMLSMNFKNQNEIVKVPTIGKISHRTSNAEKKKMLLEEDK